MALIKIRIPNWEKFNPRADRANYTWFRFQNDYFSDQAVFALTDSQVSLHIFCLCELSKKNSQEIELLSAYVAAMRKRTEKEVLDDLEALSKQGLLSVEIDDKKPAARRQKAGSKSSSLPATNERTDVTNETNETKRDETDASAATSAPAIIAPQYAQKLSTKALELISGTKAEILRGWAETYPDPEFLILEANKAANWILNNPHKAPKGFQRFFNTWLSKGWEQYRKTLKSNPTAAPVRDLFAEIRDDGGA